MDLFFVVFISLIGLIDYRIEWLSLWDEIVFIFALFFIVIKKIQNPRKARLRHHEKTVLLLPFAIIIIGVIGNILHPEYQRNSIAILKDIVAFIKFPVLLSIMPNGLRIRIKNRKLFVGFSKIYIALLSAFAVLGYFINLNVYIDDSSKLFKTFEFYYGHCTFMVSTVVCLIAILIADAHKSNKKYIILGCIVMVMSQRTKALFISLVIITIHVFGVDKLSVFFKKTANNIKVRKKYVVPVIIIIGLGGWLIAKNRIHSFWQYGIYAARPALYLIAIQIAIKYFPVGSGFGTFASSLSGKYYSGVYSKFGISNVYGLTKDSYSYMADAFVPYIYGQFGFIGMGLYVITLIKLFKENIRSVGNINSIAAIVILWLYLIFACSAETIFTNSTAVQFVIAFALINALDKKNKMPVKLM